MEVLSRSALVSVGVIAYNSSTTVIRTLDSIAAQTYSNLELIISDDHSTDDTVKICRQWVSLNKDRFSNIRIIERERNGGVSKNLNTVISAANGIWIKTIAADDILLPNCITDNITFITKEISANVVFSKARVVYESDGSIINTDTFLPEESCKTCFDKTAEEQYNTLLLYNFAPAISAFWRSSFAVSHPFSNKYPFCEDLPQWLNLTALGEKLYYFDTETVLYRRGDSLTNANSLSFVNQKFFDSYKAVFFAEIYEPLKALNPQRAERVKKEFLIGEIAVVLLHNRRNVFTRGILLLFKILLGVRFIHFLDPMSVR